MECEELLVMSKDGNDFYLVNNKTTINKASVNVSEKEDTIFTFNELIIESVWHTMIRPDLFKLYSQEYHKIYNGEKAMREEFKEYKWRIKNCKKRLRNWNIIIHFWIENLSLLQINYYKTN